MPTLQLSDKELAVVRAALDQFIHINLGQAPQAFSRITFAGVRYDGRTLTAEESLRAQALLEEAATVLTGIRNGGPNVFNKRVSNDARLALRVTARIDGDKLREGMVDEDGNPT
jgi:guanyl-specific ribonuclease Sa